uniref:Uncharacterized protein n=1 Tax=Pyrodinium bahamense TaxID=73915 RepID=A0A7S0FTX2_9DINO
MSAQTKLAKASIDALMEAAEKSTNIVDTYGGSTSGEMGMSLRAGVPVPGTSKIVPATVPILPAANGSGAGLTRGAVQARRIGSRYGSGVVPPVWLARVRV